MVQRSPQRVWAIEDCRHLTRRLEADLLRAGETVVRVPTRLMAEARCNGRERGKSDPIDALAVARAAWREPNLPAASLNEPTRQLRLLVDHRDGGSGAPISRAKSRKPSWPGRFSRL